MNATDQHNEPRAQPVVADISREIVRVHADNFGRGPTKAKTIWREDVVVCVLEDIFTRSEQATGAMVRSFLSQVSPDGASCEVFLLDRSVAG